MRIRKNSKLIHGGNTSASSSSSPSSFLICQLNRSPWDVLDAISLQGEWDASFESIPPSDSVRSGESMELSFEYVEKPPTPATTTTTTTTATATKERENGGIVEFEAVQTPPFFRHISATPPVSLPPKRAATTAPKRRGRPKKPPTSATANDNNPYEFYYYSGFGPSWAKRRGGDRPVDDDCDNKNKKRKEKKEKEDEDNGVDMVDEELDYIDDDDDEEEALYGGKRARKPIKARSLKSLM